MVSQGYMDFMAGMLTTELVVFYGGQGKVTHLVTLTAIKHRDNKISIVFNGAS